MRRALGREFRLARCATVGEARGVIAEFGVTSEVAGLLLAPVDAAGSATAPLAREARTRCRGRGGEAIPVFALVRRTDPWCPATVALIEAQPSMVLLEEDLDVSSVVRACATRLRQAAFVSAAWGALEADVPPGLRPLVRIALARADEPLSVQRIAEEMGLHRKTLWSRCRRHGLGNVHALMTWCRLLAAEHALRHCARSVDAVSEDLAFASPTALRNAVRRHLRTTPTALRDARNGVVAEGFRMWLRGLEPRPDVMLGDVA